jgi:RNA polymerase sigma-70 factor (ECF subfamily)
MGRTDDRDLLEMLKIEKSRDYAFNLLVNRYQQRLYMHVRKMVIRHEDADDIVQNTFIKAWNAVETFRGESSLFTWLYRIATNESISFLKQQKTKYLFSLSSYESILANTLKSDTNFDGDEASLKLQTAILKLPEKQRLVFNMKYFDDLSYEEISEILNTSEGALKASFHHAVKKIEKELGDN